MHRAEQSADLAFSAYAANSRVSAFFILVSPRQMQKEIAVMIMKHLLTNWPPGMAYNEQ
jgi:hypothetical protein